MLSSFIGKYCPWFIFCMLYTRLVLKRVSALTFSQLALIAFLLSVVSVDILLNIIIQDYYENKIASIDLSFRVSILTLLCALAYQFLNIPAAVKTKFQIVYFILLLLLPICLRFIEKVQDTIVKKNLMVLYYLFVSFAHACFFYYGFPGTFPDMYKAYGAVCDSYLLSYLITLGVVVFIAIIVAIVCKYTRFGFFYLADQVPYVRSWTILLPAELLSNYYANKFFEGNCTYLYDNIIFDFIRHNPDLWSQEVRFFETLDLLSRQYLENPLPNNFSRRYMIHAFIAFLNINPALKKDGSFYNYCSLNQQFNNDAFLIYLGQYLGPRVSRASSNHFNQAANHAGRQGNHAPSVPPQITPHR